MKLFQLALIQALFISFVLPCTEGCLKCNSYLQCSICDYQNGYVLKQNQCVYQNISNCEQFDLEGNCQFCQQDYFFDKQNLQCAQVDTLIPNCMYYDQQQQCIYCKIGFYSDKYKCSQVMFDIQNCQIYQDQEHCQQCQSGYTLNQMQTQCFKNPEISKCAKFSLDQCQICNYFKDQQSIVNQNIMQEMNVKNFQQRLKYFYEQFMVYSNTYEEICNPVKISNCLKFTNSNQCEQCKYGYYLQENKCIKIKAQQILNCQIYKNSKKCLKCQQDYHLTDIYHCIKNDSITNCLEYSQDSITTQCIKCQPEYYTNLLQCILRKKQIQNCQQLNPSQDSCLQCEALYHLTNDNNKCLPIIDNCNTYEQSNQNTEQLICQQCQEQYYLQENRCQQGQIQNCSKYKSTDVCLQCIQDYYLVDNICYKHDKVIFCEIHDQFVNSKCSQCISNSIQFDFIDKCVEFILIQNCKDYDSNGICLRCEDYYDLVDNQCVGFSSQKCLYKKNGLCQECQQPYYLKDSQCFEIQNLQEEYCQMKEVQDGKQICQVCQEQSLPYNIQYHTQCKQLSQFTQDYQVIQNCLVYELQQNNQSLCKKCIQNFYLKNNQCIDNCNNGSIYKIEVKQNNQNAIIFKEENICKDNQNNCKVYSPFINQTSNTLQQSCLQCHQNYVQLLQNSNKEVISYQNNQIISTPEIQCQDMQNQNLGYHKEVQNCEYYQTLYNNKIGCQKCQHGYNGQIKNWNIQNCKEYDIINMTCQKCNNQYKLSDNKLECILMPQIQNCKFYKENEINICEKCQTNFYLKSITDCQPLTDVPNCQTYHLTLDQCVQCKEGFIFSQAKDFCYSSIQYCLSHKEPTNVNDDIHCNKCQDGYYPYNKTCQKGNVQFCWRYDQTQVNKCSYYINFFTINFTKKCALIDQMSGCQKYSSKTECEICKENEYYLTNGKCCKYEKFLNEKSCDQILIPNCSISRQGSLGCDQCKNNYNFDIYQNELVPPFKCCQDNTYWNTNSNQCTNIIDLSLNIINCQIYNWQTRTCTKCKNGYYLSGNNLFCSANYKYHIVQNLQNKFEDVSTKIQDCMQYDPLTQKCLQCREFLINDTYEYELTESTLCCKKYYQHELNNQCQDNPTGCKAVDLNNKADCIECHSNYFLQNKVCCKYKNTSNIEYYDGTQCSVMNNNDKISYCIWHEKQIDNSFICKECQTDYYIYNNGLNCCQKNYTWNGKACVYDSVVLDNCQEIDLNSNICKTCKTGYYLFNNTCVLEGKVLSNIQRYQSVGPVNNCIIYDDNKVCQQCHDKYQLSNDSSKCSLKVGSEYNGIQLTIDSILNNCAYVDTTNFKCTHCYYDSYLIQNHPVCCKLGQKFSNTNTCIDNEDDQDCLKVDQNNACILKKNTQQNCEVFTTQCTQCKIGYTLVNNVCTKLADINELQNCNTNSVNKNCISIDAANCKCTQCRDWSYGDHCCAYGTKWNSNTNECESITNEYCAEWDSTNNKCTQCFFDFENKLIKTEAQYKIIESQNYIVGTDTLTYPDSYENIYINTSDQCCPVGRYYNGSLCQKIDIKNCRKSNDNTTCQQCDFGYKLLESDTICCQFNYKYENGSCVKDDTITDVCDSNYYQSNNHCVPYQYYYDILEEKQIPLIDNNCQQSDSQFTCKVCATNYELKTYYQKAVVNISNRPQGKGIYKEVIFNKCILSTNFTNLMDIYKNKQKIQNCQLFKNNECTTCNSGFYKSKGICCQQGQTAIQSTEQTYCIQISTLYDDNCLSQSSTTQACQYCKTGYVLSYGRCCAIDHQYDFNTHQCIQKIQNCQIFNIQNKNCEICKYGYIKFKNYCVPNGQYYNTENSQFENVSNLQQGCVSMTDDNICLTADTGYYIHLDMPCLDGQYNKDGVCTNISELGDYTQNCVQLDFYDKCQKCQSSFYVTNGWCCEEGKYYNSDSKQCELITQYANCSIGSESQGGCITCQSNYYFSQNNKCIEKGTYLNDNTQQIENITLQNCKQTFDNVNCNECPDKSDYILIDKQCYTYGSVDKSTIPLLCYKVESNVCLECANRNHYITNQNCCSINLYYDGTQCTAISNVYANCVKYINNECTQCDDGYYMSSNQACCLDNQYAVGFGDCQDITITNCAQSNDNTTCLKCKSGFALVNNTCQEHTINDCDIGANETQCLICKTGFYLNQGQCIQQDSITNCAQMIANQNACEQCDSGYYYNDNTCCATGYTIKTINNQKVCVSMLTTQSDCTQYSNGACLGCGTGKYITQNNCCQENHYFDTQCQQSTAQGLQNCKQFEDSTKCTLINNSRTDSCLNNEYLHQQHCCAISKYWNSTNSACEDISNLNNKNNCTMLNDVNECITCSSGYLSNGLCCQLGEYNYNETCVNINRNNCQQFDGKNCLVCSTGNLSSYGKCCDQNFYFSDNTCNATIQNSLEFDIFTESINTCDNNYYVTQNKKICCQEGQFNNNDTCEALTTTNCLISLGGDQLGDCRKCSNQELLIDNTTCVVTTKTALTISNEHVQFDKSIMINNCNVINDNGECTTCVNDGNLQNSICCNKQQYFSITTQSGSCQDISISNCDYGNTICTKCSSDQFPTSDQSKCCQINSYPISASECGEADSAITKNCIEFVSTNQTDADKKKCKTCRDDYQLYTNTSDGFTLCCGQQYIPDFDLMKCIQIDIRSSYCHYFDLNSNNCLKCSSDSYYISSDGVCCPENYYHKTKDSLSCTKSDDTVANCSKIIKNQNGEFQCTACQQDYYLSNGNCCQEKFYFDTTCKDITDQNCLQTQDNSVCDKCINTYKRNGQIICCKLGEYLDSNNQCQSIQIVDNCNKVEDDDNEGKLCEVCKPNYNLTINKICCQTWEVEIFKDKLQCTNAQPLNEPCKIWDRKNVYCKECQSSKGYYASNGRCCLYGKYNPFGTKDGCIDITQIDNCNSYDEGLGCVTCKDGYILNLSKRDIKLQACVQKTDNNGYIGCVKGDTNLSQCIECEQGYYLHKKQCAEIGKKRSLNSDRTEDSTGIQNCLKVNDIDQCIDCKQGYYVTDNKLKCCLNGYYLNLQNDQCENTLTLNTVQNCQQFKDDETKCKKCNDGYFLTELQNKRNMCINFRQNIEEKCLNGSVYESNNKSYFECSNCEYNLTKYILEDTQQVNIIGYQQLAHCEYYDTTNLFSTSTFTCKKCQNNSQMYLNNEVCETRKLLNIQYCVQFLDYDQDICSKCAIGYYLSSQNICHQIPVQNCYQYNEQKQQCEVCNEGYVLVLRNDQYQCVDNQTLIDAQLDNPDFYDGFVDSCQQNQECINIRLGGLNAQLYSMFSCHVCLQEDQIPFVSVRFKNEFDIRLSRFRNFNGFETNKKNILSSQCLKIENEFFKILIQNFNFPKNCGLGFINTEAMNTSINSIQNNADKNDLKIFCAACKPGYKPYYSNIKLQVYFCQKIQNCAKFGQNFNQCDQCEEGFSFGFNDVLNQIDYSQCIYFKVENCLVVQSDQQSCKYCKSGYTLNNDNQCEAINSSYCDGSFVYQQNLYNLKDLYYIMKYGDQKGCNQCKKNYVQIYETEKQNVCLKKQKQIVNIKNCLYYKNDFLNIQCEKCIQNYILDINQNCIQINENLITCKLAKDEKNCQQCQDNFIQSDGQCIEKQIENCQKYHFNKDLKQMQCLRCEKNYYIYQNQCVQQVTNDCLEYNEDLQCIKCQNEKILIKNLEGLNQCVNIPYNHNCEEYGSSLIQNSQIYCEKCKKGFKKINELQNLCVPIFYIQDCIKYDRNFSMQSIQQKCLQCKQNYYLKNNKCYMQKDSIQNCLKYDYQNQLCIECEKEQYFDLDFRSCLKNPNGVQNCRQYHTENICLQCEPHFYLKDNICVKTDQKIDFCEFYDENQMCQQCQKQHILENGICIQIIASNCENYLSHKQCKTCKFGYTLEQNEPNIINCIKLDKPVVDNCIQVSDNQPYYCEKCLRGYYPIIQQCVKVDNLIDNCELYDGQQRCQLCKKSYILTQDKLNCIFYSANYFCDTFQEQFEPQCVKCDLYHDFVDDQCILQRSDLDLETCQLYEQNEQGLEQCALCKSSYYMNENFKCVENTFIKQKEAEQQNQTQDILSNILSLMIYKIYFILVYLF